MTYEDVWLTDRSRIEHGHECAAKRYYRYHAGVHGKGMVRKAQAVPLVTGGLLHECLADILIQVQETGEIPDKTMQQLIVSTHVASYHTLVQARGFSDEEQPVRDLLAEQTVLLAGVVYSWVRVVLPELLAEWEIVHVEQEFNYVLDERTTAMIRPDVVLRHRRTKKLVIFDWKTTAYMNESYIQEWTTSPQMMLTASAVAKALGEPVDHFYIAAIHKGARKADYNEESGKYDGPERQQSFLVWPYYNEGTPPFVGPQWRPDWKYDCEQWNSCDKPRAPKGKPHRHTLGKGWSKQLVKDPWGWVQDLPLARLSQIHYLLGPYEVDHYKVEQLLRTVRANEYGWRIRTENMKLALQKGKWEDTETQNSLDQIFPRSYKCYSYGRRCPYYDLCFKQLGWQNPEGSLFIPRRPHHEQEIVQMTELGIPVPDELGEYEEDAQ